MDKEKVLEFFRKYKKFTIIIHQKPDGDCVGSSLALKIYLEKKNKKCKIVLADSLPEKYNCFPCFSEIEETLEIEKLLAKQKTGAIIFLDCANFYLGGCQKKFFKDLPILNIDHHPTNELFGNVNYVLPKKSAACEILYDLFINSGFEITKDIATLLFAGIFTDTGGFQHSNTNLEVLEKASYLQGRGVNVSRLSKRLFNTRSVTGLKVLGLALSRINLNKHYNIVYSLITEKDRKKYDIKDEDLEGVVHFISCSPNVAASLLLYEKDGQIKGSLRTEREDVDVSRLAQFLKGGGHKKASGFRIAGNFIKKKDWQIV